MLLKLLLLLTHSWLITLVFFLNSFKHNLRLKHISILSAKSELHTTDLFVGLRQLLHNHSAPCKSVIVDYVRKNWEFGPKFKLFLLDSWREREESGDHFKSHQYLFVLLLFLLFSDVDNAETALKIPPSFIFCWLGISFYYTTNIIWWHHFADVIHRPFWRQHFNSHLTLLSIIPFNSQRSRNIIHSNLFNFIYLFN